MNKYQEYNRHEAERHELTNRLQQANREVNQNLNEMEGWAERVMAKILAPMGKDAAAILETFKSNKNGAAHYKREQ